MIVGWIRTISILVVCSSLTLWYFPAVMNAFPGVGVLLMVGILSLNVSFVCHVFCALRKAQQARKCFLTYFPEYCHLDVWEFLGVTSDDVEYHRETLEQINADPLISRSGRGLLLLLRGLDR